MFPSLVRLLLLELHVEGFGSLSMQPVGYTPWCSTDAVGVRLEQDDSMTDDSFCSNNVKRSIYFNFRSAKFCLCISQFTYLETTFL